MVLMILDDFEEFLGKEETQLVEFLEGENSMSRMLMELNECCIETLKKVGDIPGASEVHCPKCGMVFPFLKAIEIQKDLQ